MAALIGLFYTRSLKLSDFPAILLRTGLNTALVLFLVAAAGVFSWVLIFGQVPQTAALWIQDVATTPTAFMLLVLVMLLIVGTVIDGIPGLIMVVPILLPIATGIYGIDPLHFGVVVSINLILGLLTPPVGIGLYVAASVTNVSAFRVFSHGAAVLPRRLYRADRAGSGPVVLAGAIMTIRNSFAKIVRIILEKIS